MFPRWGDWNVKYTARGLRKRRLAQIVRAVSAMVALLALIRAWKSGLGLRDGPTILRSYLRSALYGVLTSGIRGLDMLRARLA